MFLVNKYRIKNRYQIKFHYDIYNKILKKNNYDEIDNFINNYSSIDNKNFLLDISNLYFNDYNDMNNLILYGPKGSGKKTLINILLNEIYGKVGKLNWEIYNINYNSEDKEIELLQSNHHIVLNPNGSAIDKNII
jgi:DNA replication protein DnaC